MKNFASTIISLLSLYSLSDLLLLEEQKAKYLLCAFVVYVGSVGGRVYRYHLTHIHLRYINLHL